MGDSGLAHQVGTLPGSADNLHNGGILQVIHVRDFPVTQSTSFHSVGQGSQVHYTLLEEFPEGHGDAVDDEYCVSTINGWLVGEDHTSLRGHVTSMCLGF